MQHNHKPGDRVVAILDVDPELKRIRWFDEGEYLGDLEVPDEVAGTREENEASVRSHIGEPVWSEEQFKKIDEGATEAEVGAPTGDPLILTDEQVQEAINHFRLNPCIKLDNGEIVWGRECWWGDIEATKLQFPEGDWNWVQVDIREARKLTTGPEGSDSVKV